jgi:hypothetical protein
MEAIPLSSIVDLSSLGGTLEETKKAHEKAACDLAVI